MSRVQCIGSVGRLARLGPFSYIVCLDHVSRLCIYWPHTLMMVHLSWPMVRKDHCLRVVAIQPSDGPVGITEPHGHVQCHSDGYWPISLSEVRGHGDHVSVYVLQLIYCVRGPTGHV